MKEKTGALVTEMRVLIFQGMPTIIARSTYMGL